MRKRNLKNKSLAVLMLSTVLGCSISPLKPGGNDEKFERIALGDSGKTVTAIWGTPEIAQETYGGMKMKTLNFLKPDGSPDVFFSIDESDRVVGKAQWIYSSGPNELEALIARRFKGSSWKTYVPCRTRGDRDKILVDNERNLSVDIGSNGTGLISWTTAKLLAARIDLLLKSCPKLQVF